MRECWNLTDASIIAASNCPLTYLDVGACQKITVASITAVADKCNNLAYLCVGDCNLLALPANIGKLSQLRMLDAYDNVLEELPRSIVDLDDDCTVELYDNPLHTPPLDIATFGIPAIRRYFEQA